MDINKYQIILYNTLIQEKIARFNIYYNCIEHTYKILTIQSELLIYNQVCIQRELHVQLNATNIIDKETKIGSLIINSNDKQITSISNKPLGNYTSIC